MKGTTYPSFQVGKKGPTLYQGSSAPSNSNGNDGDFYIQFNSGSNTNFTFQRVNGVWLKIQRQSAYLDEISALTLSANGTLASDGTNIIINTPSQQITAMGLGTAALLNANGAPNNLFALDANGLIPTSVIPPLSIINVYVVADNAARDALITSPGVQTGDVAIVSSSGLAYIYDGSQWHVLAAANAVQAIQTNQIGVVKTGVVSLATTDILSGVFPEARGGTNQNYYNAGDLLVGNSSNGLSRLGMGTTAQVLSIASGSVSWNTLAASNITFTANTANNISSINVQNAIVEVANEHTFINVATTAPTNNNDSSQNYKIGDLWINTTNNKAYVATKVSVGLANWLNLTAVSSGSSNNTLWYVSPYGSDDPTQGDGSVTRPYLTIGNAITNASSGDKIIIYPGTYTESLTPGKDIILDGIGVNNDLNATIVGTQTLGSYNFGASKIIFQNTSGTVVSITAGSKNYTFDNCQLLANNVSSTCVSITGTVSTGYALSFSNTVIQGITNHNHGGIAIYDRCSGTNWNLSVANSGATVKVHNTDLINYITHNNGNLLVDSVAEIISNTNGDGIVSTSNTGLLYLSNVNLHNVTSNSFGNLNKSGSCNYILSNVQRASSTLSGTRLALTNSAEDIYGDYASPTNYTPSTDAVTNHLKAIDSKFANISIRSLTDVYNFGSSDSNKTLMVNGTGTAVNVQRLGTTYSFSSSTYNVVSTDFAKNIDFNGTSTSTVNLPAISGLYDGWYVNIKNKSTVAGLAISVVPPSGYYINGASSLSLRPQEGLSIYFNSDNSFNTYAPPFIRTFSQLDDAPSYTANKFLKINSSGTAVICASTINTSDITGLASVATGGSFLNLTDTISSYTGHGMQVLRVNSGETAVEPGVILGTVATLNYGTSAGQIPILDSNGKIQSSVIPHISLTNVTVVTTNAQRDALNPLTGDVCRVTSTGITYMWSGSQWISIQTPDVISSVNGYTGAVVLAASDLAYTPPASTQLTATNVQDAITQVANTRPYLTISTSSPSVSNDSSQYFKQGDIWINTTSSRVYFALSVAVGAAVWSQAGGGSPLNNVGFVSTTGDDTNGDGSIARPFATIQHTIENVGSVVVISPGTYTQNITLDQNVCLIGMGDPSQTVISGSLTCSNTSPVQVKNLTVNNGSGIAITLQGSSQTLFENVTATSTGSTTVKTTGSNNVLYKFMSSSIVGTLTLTRNAGTTFIDNTSQATNITATGENFQAKNCAILGTITHSSGLIDLMNIDSLGGLTSTASTLANSVNLDGVKFLNSSLSYTTLSLGTSTYYRIKNTTYNPTTILPANRVIYEQLAADINVNYSPTNFTATGADVTSQITGIDTALGLRLQSVSGDTSPSLGGDLNVNGHNITSTSSININPTTVLSIGGIEITPKTSIIINNNISTPTQVYSFPASYNSMIMEYGIKRGSNGTRTSTFMTVTDGSTLEYTDNGIDIGDCGVSVTAALSSGTVYIYYTSTNTGTIGTLSFTAKKFAI